tara:strand:+ start:874 stop:1329 length:456 start_codon:yes stop_codon:yes gene_type:complete
LSSFKVKIGSVVDLDTGVVYGSRTQAIEALGRDVVVPILHSRKKHKRFKVITVEDRAKSMYEQLEDNIARSVVEMTWAIKGMERAAKDGYSPSDAVDVRCTIECLMEDLEEYLGKIREASRYLENKEYEDTDRREFKYERVQQFTDMVHRL